MKPLRNRAKAIDAMCKDCIYDSQAKGTWRLQVENCPNETTCPLWSFRPVTIATQKAVAKTK